MSSSHFDNEHLQFTSMAHKSGDEKLMLFRITALERETVSEQPALQIAVVIDRSGSMSGAKLRIASEACARMVRSLRSEDRIAAVAYDDDVDVISPPTPPTEGLARILERIEPGGSTNLFGGWDTGAKLLGSGGRVILLSDGLANVGPFVDAATLAEHAECALRRDGITTSTVGVGEDYDEELMAALARAGGGFHYFAKDAESIMDAFARERFLVGALALADVRLEWGGQTIEIGRLLGGEIKHLVVPADSLADVARLTYVDAKSETRHKVELPMPKKFGNEPLATAYKLVEQAAVLADRSLSVRDRKSASSLRQEYRDLLLKVNNHELADQEPLASLVATLECTLRHLGRLISEYKEQEASLLRKRQMQTSFNVRNPGQAYSPFEEEATIVSRSRTMAYAPQSKRKVDPKAFGIRPPEFWLRVPAAPLEVSDSFVRVGLLDPMDGFAVSELEKLIGLRVVTDKRPWSREEIEKAIRSA